MENKLRVGIIGCTGMVGQRFITLLHNHPFFQINALIASPRSAGKMYAEAVEGKWRMPISIPSEIGRMTIINSDDVKTVSDLVDFVFCAVDMPASEVILLEERYAKAEIPVVSNNSANRWTNDVPMVIPEINPQHLQIIEYQKKRLGTKRGFIVAKPNCSIQSYVPAINPLLKFGVSKIFVSTYQAISGAGKTFESFPEILDNCIPFIKGEEEKSEREPLKIWGNIENGFIIPNTSPSISAHCVRVPVADGHLATVSMAFDTVKPSIDDIIAIWKDYRGLPQELNLPSAPKQFLNYFNDYNRPQTKLDRDLENGMAISIGRLENDAILSYKFVCLSHNTLRGAAGGAVLIAELLKVNGYFN